MIRGIDVSSWQKNVDFKKVAESGVVFVFVKCTEGSGYTSPAFERQWADSASAGLLRGAYHFFLPLENPEKQIERFVAAVEKEKSATPGELPLAFDFEGHVAINRVQPQIIVDAALRGLARLEALTGVPLIYTGPGFFNLMLNGSKIRFLRPAKNALELTRYPLWQAQYASKPSLMPWPIPAIKTPSSARYTIWQDSGSGTIPGVAGRCDTNIFEGSEEALLSLKGKRA